MNEIIIYTGLNFKHWIMNKYAVTHYDFYIYISSVHAPIRLQARLTPVTLIAFPRTMRTLPQMTIPAGTLISKTESCNMPCPGVSCVVRQRRGEWKMSRPALWHQVAFAHTSVMRCHWGRLSSPPHPTTPITVLIRRTGVHISKTASDVDSDRLVLEPMFHKWALHFFLCCFMFDWLHKQWFQVFGLGLKNK